MKNVLFVTNINLNRNSSDLLAIDSLSLNDDNRISLFVLDSSSELYKRCKS